MDAGSINAKVGVDLAGAIRGFSDFEKELLKIPEFLKAVEAGTDAESLAARKSADTKRQQIALERELRAAKAQLAETLGQESAAQQAVAARYNLLTNAQRAQLIAVREQITAQRALAEAEIQSGLAEEKRAAAAERAAARIAAAAQREMAAAQRRAETVGRLNRAEMLAREEQAEAAAVWEGRQRAVAVALAGQQARTGWESALVGGGGGRPPGGPAAAAAGGWDDPRQRLIAASLLAQQGQQQQQGALERLGPSLRRGGDFLTRAVTTPILGFGAAALYAGTQVQGAEAGIRAGTGLTGERLQSVQESFRRVAPNVAQPLKEVGEAVTELERRTGLTGAALERLATEELNLQRVTQSGQGLFKDTAQLFQSWNIPLEQQVPVLNELLRAHQLTGVNIEKLTTTATKQGAAFRELGLSYHDTIALLATFEKTNVPVERVLFGLHAAIGKIAKSGQDVQPVLHDMLTRISNMNNPTKALEESIRLFGARVGTHLFDSLRRGKFSLAEMEQQILHGSDTIDQAAKNTETLSVVWGKMRNAIEIALAPLGKVLIQFILLGAQALRPTIEWLGKVATAFSNLSPGWQSFVAGTLLVIAAAGPVLKTLGGLIEGFQKLRTAVTVSSAAVGGAEGVAGIGAAAVATGALWVGAFAAMGLAAWGLATNFHGVRDALISDMRIVGGTLEKLPGAIAQEAPGQGTLGKIGGFLRTTFGDPAANERYLNRAVNRAAGGAVRDEAALNQQMGIGPKRRTEYVTPGATGARYRSLAEFQADQMADRASLQMDQMFALGTDTPGMSQATHDALYGKGKKSPQDTELKRYTEELTQARARLAEAMAGEDNIAQRVAARYHLLTAAQRENLVTVLQQLEHANELNRVNDTIEKNTRMQALLHRGLAPEVARLGGEYMHLSQAELQHAFASQKATEAAFKAAESHRQYTKDLLTVNAEIRRLKMGHDAEASGVDALREKYPGLSNAMLTAMNNAIQWRRHLAEMRQEAHAAAGAVRGLQESILEAGAGSNLGRAALSLFGAKELERGATPPNAEAFYSMLPPDKQAQARQYAGKQAFGGMDTQIDQARRAYWSQYDTTGQGRLTTRAEQAYRQQAGPNAEQYLNAAQIDTLRRKAQDLVQVKDWQAQIAAAQGVVNQRFDRFNQVLGTSEPLLQDLRDRYQALTGTSTLARSAMERYGVQLENLPKRTQAAIRSTRDLERTMEMFQQFTEGLRSVFENLFTDLYQHGFHHFFTNLLRGIDELIGQIAAKFLAARLTDFFTNLLGGLAGGAFGGGGSGGSGVDAGAYRAGYAGGGSMSPGMAKWVGEGGPELWIPSVPGRIVPHTQSESMGGHTFNFYVQATDAASFRRNQGAMISDAYRHAENLRRRNG